MFCYILLAPIRSKIGRYIDVTAVPSRHFFHVLLGYKRAPALCVLDEELLVDGTYIDESELNSEERCKLRI